MSLTSAPVTLLCLLMSAAFILWVIQLLAVKLARDRVGLGPPPGEGLPLSPDPAGTSAVAGAAPPKRG